VGLEEKLGPRLRAPPTEDIMNFASQLPPDIADFVLSQFRTEYATTSAAGVPIDTPTLFFANADQSTLDLMTGLAYPVKAERARRNPKVGLLVEGGPDDPVVSIAGLATVRDSDFQANLDRYVAETIVTPIINPKTADWNQVRQAVWYLTRIMVSITPVHVRWWDRPADMDGAPKEWRAPAGLSVPPSDPAPPGSLSEGAKWAQPTWQELAHKALATNDPAHVTLVDAEGHPLPIRAREVTLRDEGFDVVLPKAAPWTAGKATLTYRGRETFVGEIAVADGKGLFRVERILPVLPLTDDASQVINPSPETRAGMMKRLEQELARRGATFPVAPEMPPAPTPGALRRVRGWKGRQDAGSAALAD
jgi:hypothetical protein